MEENRPKNSFSLQPDETYNNRANGNYKKERGKCAC